MQQAEEDAVEATPSNCVTWDSIEEVVILGLGSLERSNASRCQLALVLLMVERFLKLQSPVCVRDPALTELDKAVLRECQCQVFFIPLQHPFARPEILLWASFTV